MDKDEVRELLNINKTGGINFCVKCALSKMGWALEEGYEEKYLCPVAYEKQRETHCPINKYPNRKELCKEIDKFILIELSEKEKEKLFWEVLGKEEK